METRTLAGKTFYLRGEAWVDGDYEMADKGSIKELNLGYLSLSISIRPEPDHPATEPALAS